jgi:hypothetical protein
METYEITKDQYDYIIKNYRGHIFQWIEDDKYYIKTYKGTKKNIEQSLNMELKQIKR